MIFHCIPYDNPRYSIGHSTRYYVGFHKLFHRIFYRINRIWYSIGFHEIFHSIGAHRISHRRFHRISFDTPYDPICSRGLSVITPTKTASSVGASRAMSPEGNQPESQCACQPASQPRSHVSHLDLECKSKNKTQHPFELVWLLQFNCVVSVSSWSLATQI